MYIIFNKDGSVSESQLTDYINQHSDGVNYIDISIVGKSVDEYTADGNFKLPNNEVVSLTGSFTNKIKTSTGVYEGYRITLTAVVTEYQGDVALSIQVFNSDKTTLFTYPVTLYVNETTGRGGDPISQDQYEALRAMMADYQLQYARSNMRSYDTLAEATEDLPNLSNGQMILAKETADSETSSVYQKVGDKLEGVSLDGLAVDKFLRKHNAQGTGTFTWTDETEAGNVDFKINATASKSYADVFGQKILPMMKLSGNPMYKGSANGTTLTLYSSEGDTTQYDDPKIVLEATNKGYSVAITPFYVYPPLLNGKRLSWMDTSKTYIYHDFDYFLSSAHMGIANGVATLDANSKIPTSQLPSYVSDVLEFPSFDRFPTTGEVNKIYIALDTNKTYRWGGTVYVEIGSSLALGETSETAYAGDKGKRNADNITALQSEKLNRKSGLSVTPETLVYACEAGGAESSYVDKFIVASLSSNGNSIPIRATNGAIYGRSSQVSEDPEIAHVLSYELITKAYADKEYVQLNKSSVFSEYGSGIEFRPGTKLKTESIYGGVGYGDGFVTIFPDGDDSKGINFVSAGTQISSLGETAFTGVYFGSDIYGGGDLSALNPAWKSIYGMVSAFQGQWNLMQGGFEALGFTNSKSYEERATTPNPSRLTFFSPIGTVSYYDLAGNAQYDYQLPNKSGTIALTSDLSEAGTSVTIRRW